MRPPGKPGGRFLLGCAVIVQKLCHWPGCDDLAVPGHPHCEDHLARRDAQKALRRQAAKRGSNAWSHLYQTPEWKRARLAFLRAHPLCASCAEVGLVEPAREVDHKTPHRGDRALFWDRKNWQGLCKPCHSRKTAAEVLNPRGGV
jgi:5-methylcytosine-specific restriction protein A